MPIFLQYHKVTSRIEIGGTWVHPSIFRNHVNLLKKLRIPSLKKNDLKKSALPENGVLFTFDDAYSCIFKNAYPILKKSGYIGAVFVITNFIGKENSWDINFGVKFRHLNAEELKMLAKDGWIIGSHTHTHRDLTRLSDNELKEELSRSKKILEQILGEEVFSIAYPYGRYSKRVLEAAKNVGYRIGFGTHKGKKFKGYENMAIRRRGVYAIDFSIRAKIEHIPVISWLESTKEYLISRTADLSPLLKNSLFGMFRKEC